MVSFCIFQYIVSFIFNSGLYLWIMTIKIIAEAYNWESMLRKNTYK